MSDDFDMRPDTHLLEAIRSQQKPQYHVLLGEAVDNSFDAGARAIAITINEKEIVITDDGMGVARDKWQAMVRLGMHMPTGRTALGRYGVGIKYQAIAAGDQLNVVSRTQDGGEMLLRVNWQALIEARSWKIPAPVWTAVRPTGTGTRVRITELRKRPSVSEVEKARDEITAMFYPALVDGCQIVFNGEPIVPAADPDTTNTVKQVIEVAPGKTATVHVGMLRDPKSKVQGVQISYRHRVLKSRCAFGCEQFSISGMFARVDLAGSWRLKTFKDGLDDPDEAALEGMVHEVMLPVLIRCRTESLSANVESMKAELNAMLPAEIAAVRPTKVQDLGRKGEKKKRVGAAPDAPVSDTGPARGVSQQRSKIMIDFGNAFEEYGYGRIVEGRPSRIFLAEDNPHINTLLAQRDKEAARRELYVIAMAIYLNAPQMELPLEGEFGMRLWRLIERQDVAPSEIEVAA